MSYKTRKRIWPVSLAAALGVVAALALMAATVWTPGSAQAQDAPVPPSAPESLTAMAISATQVDLSWEEPANFANTVTKYRLQREDGDDQYADVTLGRQNPTMRTHSDTTVSASTTYTYRVSAVNVNGQSRPWTVSAAVTTPAAGSTPTPITPMPSGPIVMIPSDDGCGVVFNGDYDLAADGTIEVKCQVADNPDQVDILRVQFQKSTRIDPELQAVGEIVFTDYRSDDTQVVNEPEFMRELLDAFDDADESADAAGTQISVPDDPATELRVPNAVTTSDGTENGVQYLSVMDTQTDSNSNVFILVYSREHLDDEQVEFGEDEDWLSGATLLGDSAIPTVVIQVEFVDPIGVINASVDEDTVCQVDDVTTSAMLMVTAYVALNADVDEDEVIGKKLQLTTPRVIGTDDDGEDILATAVFADADDDDKAFTWTIGEPGTIGKIAGPPVKYMTDITLNVLENAPAGTYTITVQQVGLAGLASDTITVTVAGPTVDLEIDGPEWIGLGTTEGYTVIRKDKNDVVTTCDEIPVGLYIQGGNFETDGIATDDTGSVDSHGDHHMLKGDTFSITAASDAVQGDEADIVVFLKEAEKDRMTVTFGAEPVNMAPMAGETIADQTVEPGGTVMVQSTITDADTGDTLTWLAMSDMTMYATAEVDDMGMVTITGVAAGMATITVTATDMADAMATQAIMVTVNTAPMTVGTIAAVTVAAGQMSEMDVSGYFSDADTGDTLKYTAMSDMEMYATVMVDGSMLTITGVAAGMATITVTATDAAGAYAMQTIMVTVEAVDTTPMAPTGVMATVDDSDPGSTSVTVTWTDGANVPAHGVVLFANNFTEWNYIGKGTGGTLTFPKVASGSYIAVVVALDAQGGLMTDAQDNYLYAGTTVVSVH